MRQIKQKGKIGSIFGISLVLLFILQFKTLAQQSILDQPISVNFDSIPLAEALNQLSLAEGIQFSFSPVLFDQNTNVRYKADQTELRIILSDILHPFNIGFKLVGKHIVLQREIIVPEKIEKPKTKRFTISGFMVDISNQEALIGAAIYNPETGTGTLTNNYGFFSLTLVEGIYNLKTSYLGYESVEKEIVLSEDKQWNIALNARAEMMEEVIINAINKEGVILNQLAAQTEIKANEVIQQSTVLGVDDLLRSLDNLPGISFHGDGSSYFYVRGGNRDQNMILLDEAPIYNPSHMLGLFTPISPDVVKTTRVYKADFPVEYGGRLSSLIDIRTRDGNMEKFSGMASLGLLSGMLNIEGPFKRESSSYFLSYRRSHFGNLLKVAQPTLQDFYFDDFTMKINTRIGQKNRLYFTVYNGNDKFINQPSEVKNGLEWSNKSFTARWNHIFDNQLFLNTILYTSKYDYYLHTNVEEELHWNSHISSTHLKTDFTYYLNPENRINFGGKIGTYIFNPGNYTAPEIGDQNVVSKVNSGEIVLYAGNRQQLSNRININYGFRLSSWNNFGEAFVVRYSDHKAVAYESYAQGEHFYSHIAFEPRLSFSYKTGSLSSLKASYNRTSQHINLINNSISPFNSLEVWLPSGPNIKPQKADILDLGFIKAWPKHSLDLSADIFYKKMYNQIGFEYHAQTLVNPLIEGELRQGNGTAYGFEFMIKKRLGRLSGEFSYAFTRSELQIAELNGNRPYPAHQDKPLDLALAMNYKLKPRWMLTMNVRYASGMTVTTPTSFYTYKGNQVPIYTEQNNQRLPDYKRLDLGSDFLLNKKGKPWEHHLLLSFYNLLNSKNTALLYFNKTVQNDMFVVPQDQLNPQELTASYRYIYAVVPSITYKIKF